MAPTLPVDTSSSSDDDSVNTALAVGLAVPLGLLSIFCLVYFGWYQNLCGIFKKSDSLKASLLNSDDHDEEISKDTANLNV